MLKKNRMIANHTILITNVEKKRKSKAPAAYTNVSTTFFTITPMGIGGRVGYGSLAVRCIPPLRSAPSPELS